MKMKKLCEMTKEELAAFKQETQSRYDELKSRGLKIDMSRGKPGPVQLDMVQKDFKKAFESDEYKSKSGFDCRNYGLLAGIDEVKELFAQLLEVESKNIIVGGNSSLELMFSFVGQCYTHGIGGCAPWCRQGDVKFIAVVPGYDRHFGIAEYFGIKMVNVPINENGPDMDMVEELVKDPMVKGMFCVPKYSNPDGYTYSDETVERLAKMKPAAKDFRIIWDNAYCVHDIVEDGDKLLNIFDVLPKYNNEDMVIEVCSTAKMTFPGAGVSALIASDNNIAQIKKRLNAEVISYDKMNQHRHVEFFKDANGVIEHMKKHAKILKPKFDIVLNHLEEELGGKGIASWFNPKGGYFISLDVMNGCAKRTGELCKEAGVVLTTVGATYPYGIDPNDSNIRIAPSYPPVDELDLAAQLLCICTKLACIEKLVG